MQLAKDVDEGTIILINLSGRGDKDVQSVIEALKK
jgi:tryptophan synthase beta subunit